MIVADSGEFLGDIMISSKSNHRIPNHVFISANTEIVRNIPEKVARMIFLNLEKNDRMVPVIFPLATKVSITRNANTPAKSGQVLLKAAESTVPSRIISGLTHVAGNSAAKVMMEIATRILKSRSIRLRKGVILGFSESKIYSRKGRTRKKTKRIFATYLVRRESPVSMPARRRYFHSPLFR